MLAELRPWGPEVSLITNSGIQFIDIGVRLDWKKPSEALAKNKSGFFIPYHGGDLDRQPIIRLVRKDQKSLDDSVIFYDLLEDRGDGRYKEYELPDEKSSTNHLIVSSEESLKFLNDIWLPIPFYRLVPSDKKRPTFDEHPGPYNWVRARITQLEQEDAEGNTHRITLAFDTKVKPNNAYSNYLSPTLEDVEGGARKFHFAYLADDIKWFLDLPWIDDWLKQIYNENPNQCRRPKRTDDDDCPPELELNKTYLAHYLNLLAILGECASLPKIIMKQNKKETSIPVDFILDIGNSRSCGILIEEHSNEPNGLGSHYTLNLRDLSAPENIYNEPFESRVEFSQVAFGKDDFSVKSGRRDAFLWPSLVRVGKEANRLASFRKGHEGSSGLSSPKRYLWSEELHEREWYFNQALTKDSNQATAEPMASLINEYGEAIHRFTGSASKADRRMPVFEPKYSCSSLMTFMLVEVFIQALMQINSPSQRLKSPQADIARHLRSVILTIPPSMPTPERRIFKQCVEDALGLVWQSLGWDTPVVSEESGSQKLFNFKKRSGRNKYWPVLPEILIEWDEATCGQLVYLYSEIKNTFGGRPNDFIRSLINRPDITKVTRPTAPKKEYITVATIDIGGGTTDLVINDYGLDYGHTSSEYLTDSTNAYIVPRQRFRESFKVAGDSILLDVINKVVLYALKNHLLDLGLPENVADVILSKILGTTKQDAISLEVLKQQLSLQIFVPMGLRILKEYEDFKPFGDEQSVQVKTVEELLSESETPTETILEYINKPIRRELEKNGIHADFDILKVPVPLDLPHLHKSFVSGQYFDICPTLTALCEVVNAYNCDVLILTGRPVRLPGVISFIRSLVPIPVGRIKSMYNYRTGEWYPFHINERIDDPKTTASVGAMLCFLCKGGRIPNFNFKAAQIQTYSSIKYLGILDDRHLIASENTIYRNIDFDNEDQDLRDYHFEEKPIIVKGITNIGYRQLEVDRWPAAPLYIINIKNPRIASLVAAGKPLQVTIKPDFRTFEDEDTKNKVTEFVGFKIENVEMPGGGEDENSASAAVELQLCTMPERMTKIGNSSSNYYWLDSGCIMRTGTINGLGE